MKSKNKRRSKMKHIAFAAVAACAAFAAVADEKPFSVSDGGTII